MSTSAWIGLTIFHLSPERSDLDFLGGIFEREASDIVRLADLEKFDRFLFRFAGPVKRNVSADERQQD